MLIQIPPSAPTEQSEIVFISGCSVIFTVYFKLISSTPIFSILRFPLFFPLPAFEHTIDQGRSFVDQEI